VGLSENQPKEANSMNTALTLKSSNKKVGPIPVTVSSKETCPPACPLINNGCYASEGFHTRLHWDKVTNKERGTDYPGFLGKIQNLKDGQLWRHNVSGDLQGSNDLIDSHKLAQLTEANTGKRGFTYTHYPITDTHNRNAITDANNNGFTVNVSTNTPQDAIDVLEAYRLPTVTIVPLDFWTTDHDKRIIRCPAEYLETTCKECKLCAHAQRKTIVGFTVHGTGKAKADIIARG
jgi:hypothetical protein